MVLRQSKEILEGKITWVVARYVQDNPMIWEACIRLPDESFGFMGITTINSLRWESEIFKTCEEAVAAGGKKFGT